MSPVFKNHTRYWSKVAVYGDYRAWNVHRSAGGDRSNFPEHSGRILDLKEGNMDAVNHFATMIEPELNEGIAVVTVPGHDPEKLGVGLKKLSEALCRDGKRIDGSGCLVRTTKIEKLAHGGDRSPEVHLKSVAVVSPELIKGRDVLLVDDVTKTGNSLEACAALLLKAGAKSVECATIGKT